MGPQPARLVGRRGLRAGIHPSNPRAAFAGFGDSVRGQERAAYCGQGSIMATHDEGDTWEPLAVEVRATYGVWAAPE